VRHLGGLVGNQTHRVGELPCDLKLPVNAVTVSEEWGVATPSSAFFVTMKEWVGRPPHEIL
jgi:FMN hydrolase / 5-amino-6-(5-phospho-D-ribitylamino)uracil phosphatase